MQSTNKEVSEGKGTNFYDRNIELQQIFSNSRKDFQKRKDLRENRLRQINEYREEQVAALKH